MVELPFDISDELPDRPADPSLDPPIDPKIAWTMRFTIPATADDINLPGIILDLKM